MLQLGESAESALEQIQLAALVVLLSPLTAIDHPPARAVRQASFAPKTSWKEDGTKGQARRLYYIAGNGIEVSVGTLEISAMRSTPSGSIQEMAFIHPAHQPGRF